MAIKVNMMKMVIKTMMMTSKEADWGPPVPIEGADEAKVEAVVVRQLATHCSGLQIIRIV